MDTGQLTGVENTRQIRIGIDVGGTHTDGVLLAGTQLLAAAKYPTHTDNLLLSMQEVLTALLQDQDPNIIQDISALTLSTTLTTNAIVTDSIDPVGMLVMAGPGIPPEEYRIGDHFHILPGSLDHRGKETAALDPKATQEALNQVKDQGIAHFGVVGKFSTRNPAHELQVSEQIQDISQEQAQFIAVGHRLSGRLNYGRRIYTAYYNAAVWSKFMNFAHALHDTLQDFGITAPVQILKADGGTMTMEAAQANPVQSVFSGPAASVMGTLASLPQEEDCIMVDIGGTTSDIALFANGHPLLEREGITIEGYPTLVRSVQVISIGVGGDSCIQVEEIDEDIQVMVGPQRLGPSMAAGGSAPTLTDAMNILKLCAYGDTEASAQGLSALAAAHAMDGEDLARLAVQAACQTINQAIDYLLTEVNSKPLYTIHEMLEDRPIVPKNIVALGGPAQAMRVPLAEQTGLPVLLPDLPGVCNAIGAALTQPTMTITLQADTGRRTLHIPEQGIFESITARYSLDDAQERAQEILKAQMAQVGRPDAAIQITQADAFTMIEGAARTGQNIRVAAQIQPEVLGQVEVSGSAISIQSPQA